MPSRRRTAASRRAPQFLVALAAACALFGFVSAAAQPSLPLTLAEAQRLALQRSPQLSSQQSMAEASREMAVAAGQLPDPQVFAGIENLPVSGADGWSLRDGMTMTRIGIMQEFPREEKRRLRTEKALREAERVEVVALADHLAVRRETATAWLNAHFAQRVERAVASQIAETELQLAMAQAAYRAGRGSQNDVLAAQQALIDLSNRTVEAQLAARRARLALSRYVGNEADRPLGELPDLARLPEPVEQLVAVEAQPEVRRLDAQAALLDTESQLAARDARPGLERRGVVRHPPVQCRHDLAHVPHGPALVAGHAAGPRVRGQAQGARRGHRDARGRAPHARGRGPADAGRVDCDERSGAAPARRADPPRRGHVPRPRSRPIAAAWAACPWCWKPVAASSRPR